MTSIRVTGVLRGFLSSLWDAVPNYRMEFNQAICRPNSHSTALEVEGV